MAFIRPFSLLSFILRCTYVAVVTYSYKTSNDNTFSGGNGYDSSDIGSILLDAVLLVAVVKVSQEMALALLKRQCRQEVALALLKRQCRQEVAPRSVACRSVACPVERARLLAAWAGSVARPVTWAV
jgi:hypothetical protein